MNKWLCGNGLWCETCNGTGRGEARDRIIYDDGGYCQFYEKCPACNGQKRIAAPAEMVLAGAVPPTKRPAYPTILVQTIEYGQLSARERRREGV